MNDLDKVREIFLSNDLDEETRRENEEKIREWEQEIIENETYLSWQDNDITKSISAKAKEAYKDIATTLWQNRKLTNEQKESLWAKQDAALWLLSITDKNAKQTLQRVDEEIKAAIKIL